MLLAILAMYSVNGTVCNHNITVSNNGTLNTTACWYNPDYSCSQLSDALNASNYFQNVCITVRDKNVVLYKPVTLRNISHVVIRGISHQRIVNCSGQGGLTILQSDDIFIFDLIFDGCVMEHNSTSFLPGQNEPLKLYSALYFSGCNDVTIAGVDVRYTNGTGLTLYDVNGLVVIRKSFFYANMPYNGDGGGGLYIEFTYHNPDGLDILGSKSANYSIYRSFFTDNVANISNINATLFIQPFQDNHLSFSRGGGISIFFKGHARNKIFNITKCLVSNNYAYWGAGIFVEFQDFTSHNQLSVDSTIIKSNNNPQLSKDSGTGGGGVRASFLYYAPNTVHHNTLLFINCTVSYNRAYWGGGVAFNTCPEQQVATASNMILFYGCVLNHNQARLGSAVDLTIRHGLPAGVLSQVVFETCTFQNNNISYTSDDTKLIGKGALYVDSVPVKFIGKNLFRLNTGSAIAAVTAGIEFNGVAAFYDNTGDSGGAIALLGGSWMTITENAYLQFGNNRAHDKGGAIFAMSIGEHDLISSRNCFIRYYNSSVPSKNWKAHLSFVDNSAAVTGESIYTTTLLPCLWTTSSSAATYNLTKSLNSVFVGPPFDYTHSDKSVVYKDIATDASQFHYTSTSLFPGQLKRLPILISDNKGSDASVYTNFVVTSIASNHTVVLDNDTRYSPDQLIRLYGEPNSSVELTLQTSSTTAYSVSVVVNINHCPPGLCLSYNNTEITCTCNCDHKAYQGVARCDLQQYKASIAPLFWAGYVDDNHIGDDRYFVTAYCPGGFCSSTKHMFSTYKELDKKICQPQNRTGILCGQCIDGMSVYSSSVVLKCGNCTNLQYGKYFGILQYMLYEMIPLILFFFLLVLFNFSLTSGPLISFIFFSQVQSSFGPYNHLRYLGNGNVGLFYSIWNLDFLETVLPPYCLMEHWSALDVLAFHYISVITPLCLIVIAVVIINYENVICFPVIYPYRTLHNCITSKWSFSSLSRNRLIDFLHALKGKFFNPYSKVLHGLVAVLVLSYAKFVYLSILILASSTSLNVNWPSNVSSEHSLHVLLEGNLLYFGKTHIKYAIPAVIIIILSTIPPVVLLVRPFLQRYDKVEEILRRWLPLTKIDLFLNEFYSCYRPRFRWYASLYFFYRIILYLSYCYNLSSQQSTAQQLLFTFILVVHCIVQPYSNKLYNCVDGIILGVLLSLSCLQGHIFFVSHGIIEEHWPSEYIGFVIACVPLAYLVIYIFVIIVKNFYSAYRQIYHSSSLILENDFDIEQEREDMFGEIDSLRVQPPTSGGQQGASNSSGSSYHRLHSVASDPVVSVNNNKSSNNYQTFLDQPD